MSQIYRESIQKFETVILDYEIPVWKESGNKDAQLKRITLRDFFGSDIITTVLNPPNWGTNGLAVTGSHTHDLQGHTITLEDGTHRFAASLMFRVEGSMFMPNVTQDNALTKLAVFDDATSQIKWKDVSTVGNTNIVIGAPTATTNVIGSSTGTSGTLSGATSVYAGLLTAAKFNEIEANTLKVSNQPTNISEGTSTVTTVDVNSSDGTNATLQPASTLRAGLMSKAKFDEVVANSAKTTNANHTGEVTGSGALTIADDVVDEANLKVGNAPTNGYVLTARSGETGGLKWEAIAATGLPISLNKTFKLKVPTETQWQDEVSSWTAATSVGAINSVLKLSATGFRYSANGSLTDVGLFGFYWSSTVNGVNAGRLSFTSSNAGVWAYGRDNGTAVRLIVDGTFTQSQYNSNYQNNTIEYLGLTYGFVYNSTTQKIWLDRNLGATQVAGSLTDSNAYGDLYQWGRPFDGHQVRTSTTHNGDTLGKPSTEYASGAWDGKFILTTNLPIDWLSTQDDSLWNEYEASPLTTKGDLLTHNATDERLPVGTNGQVLVADSTQTLGLKWESVSTIVADGSITNAKLADVSSQTIKGRNTAGTGSPEDLNATQVRSIINVEDGATADQTASEIRTLLGTGNNNLIPAAGTSGHFLKHDGTFGLPNYTVNTDTQLTNAEVRAAVEAATDSNVFTDADHTKLNGIEASADVTDATNVSAAGALMKTGGTVSGNVNFADDVKAQFGGSSDLQIYHDSATGSSYIEDAGAGNLLILSNGPDGVIIGKGPAASYERVLRGLPDGAVELYFNNAEKIKTTNTGVEVTGNVVVSGTVDGRDVDADGTKLDTIETNADVTDTANVVASLTAGTNVTIAGDGTISATGGAAPSLNKTFTLQEPTASDDITVFRTDVAITVQEVIACSIGTSPSTTYQLKHHTDRSNAGNALTTSAATTSTTTGDVASLSDATVPANSWIWLETTAASGTSVYLSIDLRYTED